MDNEPPVFRPWEGLSDDEMAAAISAIDERLTRLERQVKAHEHAFVGLNNRVAAGEAAYEGIDAVRAALMGVD